MNVIATGQNAIKAALDAGMDAIMDSINPEGGKFAQGRTLCDGTVEHNVDLSGYEGKALEDAEQRIHDAVSRIEKLLQKAADAAAAGDMTAAGAYAQEAKAAQRAFDQLKAELEYHGAPTTDRVENGTYTAAEASVDFQHAPLAPADAAGKDILDMTPDEWVAAFEDDPKAFFDQMKDLSSEERAAILTTVQNEIQETNQLFSMLSNIQSAMHDTQKAMISNLRV